MTSEVNDVANRAIADVHAFGRALFKVIQPNDVGATGSHQAGFHLPKPAWKVFSPRPPVEDVNWEQDVQIQWTDGTTTQSHLKWWGTGTRSEFHLTRFNRIRGFYARSPENVGGLLVLVPEDDNRWRCHIVLADDDRDELAGALGLDFGLNSWAIYDGGTGGVRQPRRLPDCVEENVARMAAGMSGFPTSRIMAGLATEVVAACSSGLRVDALIMERLRAEYLLFQELERAHHGADVKAGFSDLDGFLRLAQTITQRRKARAGKSLELHLEQLLRDEGVAYEAQPILDGTRPDFVFPNRSTYEVDPDRCLVLAVKTTCRDRWRQVVHEAPAVSTKYLLTTQRGVSTTQLDEMAGANVQLVVPRELHGDFVAADRRRLLDVRSFLALVT